MRSLPARFAASRRRITPFRMRCAAVLAGALLVALLLPGVVAAASPAPYAASGATGGGTSPSYVGQPILAALFVVVLGLVVAGVTVVIVRLARPQ